MSASETQLGGESAARPSALSVFALVPLTRLLILIAALAIAVPIIVEPSLRNMVTLLGAIGLAIGFALKDYVSSLIAGVVSAVELPYRPGDWVNIEGTYGEVKHVGMRTVEVQTPDDDMVAVPHLKLWDSAIYNANNGGTSCSAWRVFTFIQSMKPAGCAKHCAMWR